VRSEYPPHLALLAGITAVPEDQVTDHAPEATGKVQAVRKHGHRQILRVARTSRLLRLKVWTVVTGLVKSESEEGFSP
jgi:hypothetical protein